MLRGTVGISKIKGHVNEVTIFRDDLVKEYLEGTLTEYEDEDVTKVGYGAFTNCSQLRTVNLSNCKIVRANAFFRCSLLSMVSLPACLSIENYAFYECKNLYNMYLLGPTIPACSIMALNGTLIASGSPNGRIYVPASLFQEYISAPVWSTYRNKMVSV